MPGILLGVSLPDINIDGTIALVLVLAALIDLLTRWQAFGRFESIAIDVAIFSLVFSGIELLSGDTNHASTAVWSQRTWIGFAMLLILTVVHSKLRRQAERRLREVIRDLKEKVDPTTATQLTLLEEAVAPSLPLILFDGSNESRSGWRHLAIVKTGGFQQIEDLVKCVNQLVPQNPIKESDLLIPVQMRSVGLGILGTAGILAMMVPFLSFTWFN